MNRLLPLLAITVMAVSVAVVVVPAGGDQAEAEATATTLLEPDRTGTGPILRVVMGTRWSPVEGYERTRTFADCLREETGRPVTVIQRSTYSEANALIAAGGAEVALVCSGATADRRLRDAMVPVFRLDSGGDGTYHSVIVARADDPAADLRALRNASIAWTDPDSLTGYRAPRAALRILEEDPDGFFGPVSFTHSHDASLDAVAQGFVRVAAVDEEVLRAGHRPGLKIVWRSDAFPSPPVLVRHGDGALEAAVAAIAERPECLADLGASRLVPATWATYDPLSAVLVNGR